MRRLALPFWFTARTLWVLAAVAFLFACAPGVPLLVPAGIALLAALLAGILTDAAIGPSRAQIAVRRVVPAFLALRRAVTLRYEIENRSSRSLRIGLLETPMRTLGFGEEAIEAVLAPNSLSTLETVVPAVARGSDRFTRIYVWYENALGLIRRRVVLDAPEAIRVYPDLSAVERYGSLHVRNRLVEAGLRRMRMRGLGTEFESVRDYADGDAFRAIDWKATARRGKMMVVQREVERSQDVMMLLDCGRLMTARVGEQRKLDYAITAGLSLASIASLASDRVGVVAFAKDVLVSRAPRSTAASVRGLADALCDVEPRFEDSDYARAFRYVRSHLHRRSLIVLFTDVIDPVAQSMVLGELAGLARRHVVLCVFMNDAAVQRTLRAAAQTPADAYRLDVAVGLEHERSVAARTLERNGISVIDVPAADLSMATIDRYLRIKSRALL